MQHSIFIFWALALLVLSVLTAHFFLFLQAKWSSKQEVETRKNTDGPPRFIFQAIYLCILWASFIFLLPMILSFQEKLSEHTDLMARLIIAAKISVMPVVFLFLVILGARRGYLQWIKQLHWPSDDY